MEIIRKKICLEKSRSRVNSVLPYIPYNQDSEILLPEKVTLVDKQHDVVTEKEVFGTNYGNFQCDIKEGSSLYDAIMLATSSLTTTDEDFSGNTVSYIRTVNLFNRYNLLLDILRTSLHLKHIKNDNSCNDEGYTDMYLSKFEYVGTTYDFLREAEPVDMFDENGDESFISLGDYTYSNSDENTYDYVIVLNEYDEFNSLGGKALIDIVDDLLVNPDSGSTSSVTKDEVCVPYISIPLLLTLNQSDLGLMTPYSDENEYVYCGNTKSSDRNFPEYDDDPESWIITPLTMSGSNETINVESKLGILRVPKYFASDNNEPFPGLFVEFPHNGVGPFFNCIFRTGTSSTQGEYRYIKNNDGTKGRLVQTIEDEKPNYGGTYANVEVLPYGNETIVSTEEVIIDGVTYIVDKFTRAYKWWEVNNVDGSNLKCADGEDIQWGDNSKYQTISVFGTLLYYIEENSDLPDGSSYNFLVRYDNTEQTPMVIPYSVNTVMNKSYDGTKYTGDYIISIDEGVDEIAFEYMIGATYEDNSYTNVIEDGIYYKESYPYKRALSATTTLDNVQNTIYWYNEIDFENRKEVVYSEDFNLRRSAVITTLSSMTYADVWKSDGSVINTPLIKEEYLMSASMDAVVDIDISIDRGNATAFEKHLILGECNTFQDVENYRNNYYNL